MLKKIISKINDWRYKRIIKRLRKELKPFGEFDDLTDDRLYNQVIIAMPALANLETMTPRQYALSKAITKAIGQ
jgi:hypothetical protein